MTIKAIIQSLIFIFPALCIVPCAGVFSEMEIWSNDTQNLYLLKDCHIDYKGGRISIKQQTDLIKIARQLRQEGVCMIVEDAFSYSGTHEKIRAHFNTHSVKTIQETAQFHQKTDTGQLPKQEEIVSNASPLFCLTQECLKNNIQAYNVESKHAIVMYQNNPHLHANQRITQQEVLAQLTTHVQELSSNPLLKNQYAHHKAQLDELQKIMATKNNEKEFIQKFTQIRRLLIETQTINKLMGLKNIKHIFICQGALHIKAIEPCLSVLGYKKTKSIGNVVMCDFVENRPSSAQQMRDMLENALDLTTIFAQLMNTQYKDALKDPSNDPAFLDTEHGQKWLKETADMADDVRPLAAAAAAAGAGAVPRYIVPSQNTRDERSVELDTNAAAGAGAGAAAGSAQTSQPTAMTDDN